LAKELFTLQDLKGDGALEEGELIKLNEKIAMLHYGKDVDKGPVREKFSNLFREKLDPDGKPVPFSVFRKYIFEVLRELDEDPRAQEMILEQFIAEAESARAVFHEHSFMSASDEPFMQKIGKDMTFGEKPADSARVEDKHHMHHIQVLSAEPTEDLMITFADEVGADMPPQATFEQESRGQHVQDSGRQSFRPFAAPTPALTPQLSRREVDTKNFPVAHLTKKVPYAKPMHRSRVPAGVSMPLASYLAAGDIAPHVLWASAVPLRDKAPRQNPASPKPAAAPPRPTGPAVRFTPSTSNPSLVSPEWPGARTPPPVTGSRSPVSQALGRTPFRGIQTPPYQVASSGTPRGESAHSEPSRKVWQRRMV